MRPPGLVLAIVLAGSATAACTTLGPTPATTAISARPAGRPEISAQVAVVPGHYLSAAVVEAPEGAGIGQLAVVVEPDRWVGLPGLVVGGRVFGQDGDTAAEPVIGYRRVLADGRVAVAALASGTVSSATRDQASYRAERGGVELAVDARPLAASRWVEPHLFAGVAVTALSVDGDYCIDVDGRYGVQCPDPPDTGTRVSAHAGGAYPTGHVGVAAELFRHRRGWFHGGRVAAQLAAGAMPRVVGAQQTSAEGFAAFGLSVSLAVGD
ncbi:MAG: hypothetical protein IPL61_14825 [Myxococcales bacterium]|nr:hypothetical protein [Myxococcales bacterium]